MAGITINSETAKATARSYDPDPGRVIFAPVMTATAELFVPSIDHGLVITPPKIVATARAPFTVGFPVLKNISISVPVATATTTAINPGNFAPTGQASVARLDVILSMNDWWNVQYMMRRRLRLTSPFTDAPIDSLVVDPVDLEALYTSGKVLEDYSDVEVVYLNDVTKLFTIIPKSIVGGVLYFPLVEPLIKGEIEGNSYYVYYSNPSLKSQPAPVPYVEDLWPIELEPNSVGIAYTRPGEHWIDGASSTRLSVTTLSFVSDRIRITSTKDIDQGIAEVRLDEGDWEDVDLFSPTELTEQVVYEQTGLVLEEHKLQVRVSGRQNLASEGFEVNVAHFDFLARIEVEDLGEEIFQNIGWTTYVGGGNG